MANILIVDDSGMMRRHLSLILIKAGHEIVAEAINGNQAFLEYEKHRPDIVTMDITMPEKNGIEAIEKIMKDFPEAIIIVVSAMGEKHHILEAFNSGAKHYILKPFSPDKVISVVAEVEKKMKLNTN